MNLRFLSPNQVVLGFAAFGLALGAMLLVGWLVLLDIAPEEARAVAAGLGAFAYGGKEAGIPVALAAGAAPLQIGLFILVADVAFALVSYAIVHFTMDGWARRRGFVGRFLRRVSANANRHAGLVERFGPVGLFLVMLVPFAFNGPLLGAVLGRMIGLAAFQILPVLLLAVIVTTALWTLIYALGFDYASTLNPDAPDLIAAFVLVGVSISILAALLWGGRPGPRHEHEPVLA